MSKPSLVTKVLVVGGGVAGMAAAMRLREQDVAVDLIDIDPNWGVYGTGITLSVLTLRALCDLGLADEIMAKGNCYDSFVLCSQAGDVLAKMASPRLYAPHVPAEGGILRPVLHAIMKSRVLAAGAEVRAGLNMTELSQDGAGVDVLFSDGTRSRYDLVIGADGLFSKTRSMILPDAPLPRFTGQACWRALFDIPAGWDCGRMFLGDRVKLGFTLCSPDKMYLYLLEHVPDNPWREKAQLPGLLRQLMEDFGGEVARLRDTINEDTPILYRPLESVLLTDRWSVGRVVLIGDAVHATTPHLGAGAGAAIEDAIILCDELAGGQSVVQALADFERRRIPRASLVVNNSLKIGELEMSAAPKQQQAALISASLVAIAEPYR